MDQNLVTAAPNFFASLIHDDTEPSYLISMKRKVPMNGIKSWMRKLNALMKNK